MFGQSKNVLKSITIHQESLISNLAIIKTPIKADNYIKKQRNDKTTIFFVAVFWALYTHDETKVHEQEPRKMAMKSSSNYQGLTDLYNQLADSAN